MSEKVNSAKPRGFAAMDPKRQRELARKGGANVPKEKRSFSKNRGLAQEAGRKGGRHVAAESRSFSKDRTLAAKAGKKGGEMSSRRVKRQKESGETVH